MESNEREVLEKITTGTTANEALEMEQEMRAIGRSRKETEAGSYSKRQSADNEGHMHWNGNCLHIEGSIVREDPNFKKVGAKETKLCTFHFGRSQGKESAAEDAQYKVWLWLDVEMWGDEGEYVYENFRKGDRVALKGILEYRERMYEPKDGGAKRKATQWVLKADHCHLILDERTF